MEAAAEIEQRTVCILGCGLLGLTACAYAKYAGAKEVLAVDTNESRRRRARTFGASQAFAPEQLSDSIRTATDGKGVDVVVELSGANAAFEGVWPLVRIGGTIVLVGAVFPGPAVPIHLEQIVRRNLTIRGVHNYAPRHLLAAVDFLTEQHDQFPFRELVPKWYPLNDALAAFEHARQPEVIRIGVRPV
jgi:alcohol dehydrogenase